MLAYLILGTTYAFAAAVQPGPFQAYLVSQTLANGWRRTLPAALAPILSDVPVVALVLLVLTQVPPLFVHVLRVAGGLFLLFLASTAVAACRAYRPVPAAGGAPVHQAVLRAALVNVLNPNPYMAWALVLGPLLLQAWRESPTRGLAFVVSFYVTIVIATGGIVVLFGAARSVGPRVARALVGVSAVALGGFGLFQLWSGSSALITHFQ